MRDRDIQGVVGVDKGGTGLAQVGAANTVLQSDGSKLLYGAMPGSGTGNIQTGVDAHAEGTNTTASGIGAHSEGVGTTASGNYSHAQGAGSVASGLESSASGTGTTASGVASTAMGAGSVASGDDSLGGGQASTASGTSSIAFGQGCQATHAGSAAFGTGCQAIGAGALAVGSGCTANGDQSVAIGLACTANGVAAVAMGNGSQAAGAAAFAMGAGSTASGAGSVALRGGTATGVSSYASLGTAAGAYSRAVGYGSKAEYDYEEAFAGGQFAAAGDAQYHRKIVRGTTPGVGVAEAVQLFSGSAGNVKVSLTSAKSYLVNVRAIATKLGIGAGSRESIAMWQSALVCVTAAGVVTVQGAYADHAAIALGPNLVGSAISFSAAANELVVTFTVGAGLTTNARCVATVEMVEVLGN
jgi:trimeric autotransporter adhesin